MIAAQLLRNLAISGRTKALLGGYRCRAYGGGGGGGGGSLLLELLGLTATASTGGGRVAAAPPADASACAAAALRHLVSHRPNALALGLGLGLGLDGCTASTHGTGAAEEAEKAEEAGGTDDGGAPVCLAGLLVVRTEEALAKLHPAARVELCRALCHALAAVAAAVLPIPTPAAAAPDVGGGSGGGTHSEDPAAAGAANAGRIAACVCGRDGVSFVCFLLASPHPVLRSEVLGFLMAAQRLAIAGVCARGPLALDVHVLGGSVAGAHRSLVDVVEEMAAAADGGSRAGDDGSQLQLQQMAQALLHNMRQREVVHAFR